MTALGRVAAAAVAARSRLGSTLPRLAAAQLALNRYSQSARHLSTARIGGSDGLLRVERATDFETVLDKTDRFAQIGGRAVIEVAGTDASEFLQGLQCNHMPTIDQGGPGMLTAFLAPQGRVIADAFIYPRNVGVNFPHPVFLVEVDAQVKARLLKIMQFYKLRAKVAIRDATDEYTAWSVWGPGSAALVGGEEPLGHVPRGGMVFKSEMAPGDVWMADTRAPGMGLRLLLPAGERPALPATFGEELGDVYTLRRILKGVAEGAADFVTDVAVPLESNMDYMHGVHFSKGCYVGQELTIRTHHRGVVRKRIVPAILSSPDTSPVAGTNPLAVDFSFAAQPAALADVTRPNTGPAKPRSRNVAPGRLGSCLHNAALALMRLELVDAYVQGEGSVPPFETVDVNGARLLVSPWSPSWWPAATHPPA
ncbi:ccr4 associated factor [Linderina macrospora]|uniref:Ccr4 associated factor n=1 Tax=Linderina macrospora TaxID=4868 RepID=A0ACC1JHN3_9FUNG|nr:ccr4 associated factor [Linderina macrospora]